MIKALRTPEERFTNLPDFPYQPTYFDDLKGFEGLRAAVVDEGPKDAKHTFFCLHGEPTWSFLYRKMIPTFLASGARVVAPDFFGFGRSDKPVNDSDYTFHFHRDYLLRLIEKLDLQAITLVVQDWGGVLGLTLPLEPTVAARLDRLIVMNTGLPSGQPAGEGFVAWRDYVARTPDLKCGALLKRGKPDLTDAEVAAYDAPFPDMTFKAGVRRFPQLVMVDDASMPGVAEAKAARAFLTNEFRGKSFMAYGAKDPLFTPVAMEAFRKRIHGCPPALILPQGSHFVQEWGTVIAEQALQSFGDG